MFSFQWSPFILPLAISALMAVWLAWRAWVQREMLNANSFIYLMLAVGIWAAGEALVVVSPGLAAKLLITKIQYLGIVATPVLWLIFVIQYSGNDRWLTRPNLVLLFFIPALVLLLVWTTEFHTLYYLDYSIQQSNGLILFFNQPGPFYWINLIYSYLVFFFAVLILLRTALNTPELYGSQIGLILTGAFVPLLGNVLYNFIITPRPGMDLTPVFFTLTGFLLAWALFRHQFLELTPIAREFVVDILRAGTLVLDKRNRIVDLNPSMEKFVGMRAKDIIGKPAADVFRDWPGLVNQFQQNAEVLTEITTERHGTSRDYELQISPILKSGKKPVGRLIVLRDLTARQQSTAELERYAAINAELLAEERRQRQIAESLQQAMLTLSSSLDQEAILGEILAQLRVVLPFYSAALYLFNGEDLELVRYIGPEATTNRTYSTPQRKDQINKIFRLRKTEIFVGAQVAKTGSNDRGDQHIFSSLASPLIVGQEALGILNIDRFEQKPFQVADAEILQAFATQAAIAIKNADLHQQAKTAAAIQERNRLAQDLHDAVNQTLFTASIMAEALPQVWERDPVQGRRGIQEIRQLTRGALAEMRTLLLELRPQAIVEKPIGDLLSQLVRAVSGRTRIPIEFTLQNDAVLPPDMQVAVYRIAQESFNNIVKHAEASHASVYVDVHIDQLLLVIEDNGIGFEIDEILVGHLGLEIMRERAAGIGADLLIISRPGAGTKIELSWTGKEEIYE